MTSWKQKLPWQRLLPSKPKFQRALDLCPPDKVKVVIVGDRLYEQHNGLAFSTHPKAGFEASHHIIFKEYRRDLGFDLPRTGDLTSWAEQGVLLLPSEENKLFTFCLLRYLSTNHPHIVYLLWGAKAERFNPAIEQGRVFVASLPSPLNISYGNDTFTGCSHFSEANRYLEEHGIKPVNWKLR